MNLWHPQDSVEAAALRTSGHGHLVGEAYIRNSFLPEISRSVPLFVAKQRSTVYFFRVFRAVSHTHTHMFNIYIQKTCKYESQSKHWVQHGNPFKIWCCHVAFANGDTFLGELSNLGDHMTWPFICNGYCYTKYQGKERAKHIHPTTIYIYIIIYWYGAYMRTCSICNLFVASFARTHCPTSLLPSNTFSPRRPTLR